MSPTPSSSVSMRDSQTAPTSSGVPVCSLADLLDRLGSAAGLNDVQRRDYQGAVRTLCKVLARPAQAIPGDLRKIDQLLKAVTRPDATISRKTLANLRSRLKAALRHGPDTPKLPPRGTPLSPAWQVLNARLE